MTVTELGLKDLSNAECGGWFIVIVVWVGRYHTTVYYRSLSQPLPQEDLMKAISVTATKSMETVNIV